MRAGQGRDQVTSARNAHVWGTRETHSGAPEQPSSARFCGEIPDGARRFAWRARRYCRKRDAGKSRECLSHGQSFSSRPANFLLILSSVNALQAWRKVGRFVMMSCTSPPRGLGGLLGGLMKIAKASTSTQLRPQHIVVAACLAVVVGLKLG